MTELVDRIADIVLYEGYLLYPYRASAVKNQQRFNFGVLVPQAYSIAQSGTEAWTMQTEVLVRGERPVVRVRPRFLHLLQRQVMEVIPRAECEVVPVIPEFRPVGYLEVEGRLYQTWQEAVEREVASPALQLAEIVSAPRQISFEFGPEESIEPIVNGDNQTVGQFVRTQQPVSGKLSIEAVRLADDLYRLRATLQNATALSGAEHIDRNEALLHSFASAHAILQVDQGDFVSLLDPPEELRTEAAACRNVGCWPVLVGEAGDRQTMLASPIILYDYPEIAPESPGDFFDGTEIDEMLMLRVMTMTPAEQREMRSVDDQARRLLERTERLPPEHFMKLHGTMRGVRPVNDANSPAISAPVE